LVDDGGENRIVGDGNRDVRNSAVSMSDDSDDFGEDYDGERDAKDDGNMIES
jgi:hypothetical protein